MQPTILVIRAIGSEFAKRTFYSTVLIVAVVSVILVGLGIWLITLSNWWWLFMFAVTSLVFFGIIAFTIVFLVIRSVGPAQSSVQKRAVKQFVDKLQHLAETAGTPKFILLFRIIKDVSAPSKQGFIGSLATTSGSLKSDFTALVALFK